MKEYGIYNVKTGERKIIFGHYFKNALDRYELDSTEWELEYCEYIDWEKRRKAFFLAAGTLTL